MNIDVFRPLPSEARRENLAAYHQHLIARNGTVDLEKRQLSRREEQMARFERPLSRIREMDRELFATQYASFDPKVEIAPEMLLLLALTKINAAEAYGVNAGFDGSVGRAQKNKDDCELMVVVEEMYHTRLLLSTALSYGIEVKAPYKPPTALRGLISTIVKTPMVIARPLTLASEVLGVFLMLNLLEKSRAVLRHDPELRDSVEERLCQILTDELGHVSYNRNWLGPVGMMQARAYLPMVAIGLSGVFPEMNALGTMSSATDGEIASLATGSRLPESVARSAFLS
jgi:hypothetical protein